MYLKLLTALISLLLLNETFAKKSNWSKLPKVKYKKETTRRPTASSDNLSPEYIKLRDEYLKIKDPLKLHQFLVKIDQNYDSYPTDVKFFVALTVPTAASRSVVYRSYDLANKHKLFRASIVTVLMRLAAGIEMLEPGQQSETYFRYATEPFLPGDNLKKFKKEEDIQTYFMTEVRPLIETAIERIKNLDLSSDKIVLDLQLMNGAASFQDGIERYRLIGNPEKNLVLSTLNANLAGIYQFNSYHINGLINFNKEVSKIFGFESFRIISRVEGMSSKKFVDVFKRKEFKKLFTIRENGAEDMKKSYAYMREAAIYSHYTWNEMKERNLNEDDILRFDLVGPFRTAFDMTDTNLIALFGAGEPVSNDNGTVSITQGEIPLIRSEVTGQTVKVNMAGYFNNPPKDLKALLPQTFEEGQKYKRIKVTGKDGKTEYFEYRNYKRGMPKSWDHDQYKHLFPELKSNQKVSDAIAVIGQSFSTGVVFVPMVFAINP
jgi:hypothetical protein